MYQVFQKQLHCILETQLLYPNFLFLCLYKYAKSKEVVHNYMKLSISIDD